MRAKTGISELDEMLRGGFVEGDSVMIGGNAGTGKTILALQYLVNGATQFGENGIYVTFEQLPDQLYRDAKNFGWDLRKMEEEGKIKVICTSPNLLIESGSGEQLLDDVIREIRPRRIVIDSLSHLGLLFEEKKIRSETYRLIMYLKTKGLSSLHTWEVPQIVGNSFSITEVGLSFLVDCILILRHVEIESSMRKALVILKMRGSDHDKQMREYEITQQGIKVAAPFTGYEGIITGSPRKIATERFVEMFRKAAKAK